MKLFSKTILSAFITIFLSSNLFAANIGKDTTRNYFSKAANFAAQNNYSLSGRITDLNGAPVNGARVIAQGKFGGAEKQFITDASGDFHFENLADGDYQVKVEANGFATILREISLKNNAAATLNITLPVSGINESVTVTATRTQISAADTAVPVSVVERDEIERKAVNTIGDIFRTLPGTSTVNEGAFQVRPRIRGLDSNRVLILVDGERLNNSRTSTSQSGVEIGLVETSQIESVEVVRGSGSVLYGTDALAGTVNVITHDTPARREEGFRFGGTLDTFYSSNENGRRGSLAVNGSNKFFAFRVAQSLERSDDYSTGKADGTIPTDFLAIGGIDTDGKVLNSQSHGSNSQATVRFFINDTNTLRLNYERRRAANVGSATLVGVFNGFFPFSNRDKFSARYDTANLTKQLARVSVSAYYQTQYRNFTNILTVPPVLPFFPGQYQFSETVTDTKTSGFDLQTDWTLGSRNNLTAGASFFRDKNNDRRLIITASTPASTNRRFNNSRSVPNASLTDFAGFAQDEFRVTNRLKFIGGFRVDRFRTSAETTDGFTIPATFTANQIQDLGLNGLTSGLKVNNTTATGDFGTVFDLTKNVILSARIGRSFRTPNIFERFFTDFGSVTGFVVGNPNLEPESGINFDTSVKLRTKRYAAAFTYFNNYYKNLLASVTAIDRTGNAIFIPRPPQSPIPVYQTKNISRARIQGFEAEAEMPIKIRLGYLTPNGNFSYLRGDNVGDNVPLDSISPFRINAGVRWQNFAKNYFAEYNIRNVSRQSRLSPSLLISRGITSQVAAATNYAEPGFAVSDINGGYSFRRERFNFNINVGVSDLFNRIYREQFVFAPARGRSFTIGTTWEIK